MRTRRLEALAARIEELASASSGRRPIARDRPARPRLRRNPRAARAGGAHAGHRPGGRERARHAVAAAALPGRPPQRGGGDERRGDAGDRCPPRRAWEHGDAGCDGHGRDREARSERSWHASTASPRPSRPPRRSPAGPAAEELQRLVDERIEAQVAAQVAERVAELTRDLEERLAAAEAQPRAGGPITGDASGLDDLLERNRMTIERLGLHLGEHDRALAELMQTRSLPRSSRSSPPASRRSPAARRQEVSRRRARGARSGAWPAEPSTGEVKALMRRVEDAEVASQADREKLMNRLERMAASIDWRLQRLEATETTRSKSGSGPRGGHPTPVPKAPDPRGHGAAHRTALLWRPGHALGSRAESILSWGQSSDVDVGRTETNRADRHGTVGPHRGARRANPSASTGLSRVPDRGTGSCAEVGILTPACRPPSMRPEGFEPSTSRSGGARSIP